MDTGRTRELGDANNRIFNIAWSHHHQVSQFVNDHQQIWVRPQNALTTCWRSYLAGAYCRIEIVHVPKAKVRKIVVTLIHFGNHPLQGIGGLLGISDDRSDEVRHTFVDAQLNALGVNEDHSNLIGGGPHQNRGDQ